MLISSSQIPRARTKRTPFPHVRSVLGADFSTIFMLLDPGVLLRSMHARSKALQHAELPQGRLIEWSRIIASLLRMVCKQSVRVVTKAMVIDKKVEVV